jgi:hypothetical protein
MDGAARAAQAKGKPRRPLFRALGACDPPDEILIRGCRYQRTDILKHDSWAATAIYEGPAGKIVCKLNRQQGILGFPMRWLGRWLARHEASVLRCLRDLPGIPRWSGDVESGGRVLRHAVAHDFVAGHPLGSNEKVAPSFFPNLHHLLKAVHGHDLAYVDLHKRENILVGDDGVPYLLDFQISFVLPKRWPGRSALLRWLLLVLQQGDQYHLTKHIHRHAANGTRTVPPPWFIRGHRLVGRPFRWLRRRLLVLAGTRTGKGRADSEHFAEDAVRREPSPRAA